MVTENTGEGPCRDDEPRFGDAEFEVPAETPHCRLLDGASQAHAGQSCPHRLLVQPTCQLSPTHILNPKRRNLHRLPFSRVQASLELSTSYTQLEMVGQSGSKSGIRFPTPLKTSPPCAGDSLQRHQREPLSTTFGSISHFESTGSHEVRSISESEMVIHKIAWCLPLRTRIPAPRFPRAG